MGKIGSIGVLGAGVMGRGIAQFFLTAGYSVTLFDLFEGASDSARAEVVKRFQGLAEKGRITKEKAEQAIASLHVGTTLKDLAPCGLVVEAIYEDLAAKREIFAKLEPVIGEDAIIATNTSSFLIAEVGRNIARPERFLGVHFFNPAPLMRLVEIISGPGTAPETLSAVEDMLAEAGHTPVVVSDTNGFLVNQLGRGYVLEAARIVEEGIADYATVDEIATKCLNFPLGPFSLMDLTGLDVTYPASKAIFDGNGNDPRYQPPSLLRRRYLAGQFGKKNGRGFAQDTGMPRIVKPASGAGGKSGLSVLPSLHASEHPILGQLTPLHTGDRESTIVVPLRGQSLAAIALERNLDPLRLVGIDVEFSTPALLIAARVTRGDDSRVATVAAAFNCPAAVTVDAAGSVAQRLVLQLALIGGDLVARGIADEADVDTAARLGLGHGEGPLGRVRRLGARKLEQLRSKIHNESGEVRFRSSRWLLDAAAMDHA